MYSPKRYSTSRSRTSVSDQCQTLKNGCTLTKKHCVLNALQYLILLISISLQEVGAMMIISRTSGNRAFSAIGKSYFWKSSCLYTASRSTSNRTYNGLPVKYPNHLFSNTEQNVNDTSCHATTTTSVQTMSNAISYTTTGCDRSTKSSSLISHEESFPQAKNHIPPTKHDEYETVFSLDVPEGKCVALRLSNPYQAKCLPTSLDPYQIQSNPNHWLRQILHPEEIEYGCQLSSEPARISFFMGRLAMRTALAQAHGNDTTNDSWEYEDGIGGFAQLPIVASLDQSILKDEHGRPQVPQGFIGSISHKATTGVALIAPIPASYNDQECQMTPKIGIGVDIEQAFSRRRNIAKKILTPNELNDLGNLNGVTRDEEVLLRFSLKESVYKAMHPLICQFVGFQEAEIKPHSDGTATINLFLKSGAHEMFKETKAHWRRIEGDLFLTSASITLH